MRYLISLCLFILTTFAQHENLVKYDDVYETNHKPLFKNCSSYTSSVKEENPNGTYVITVKAEDSDSGLSGLLNYTIESAPGKFSIDNKTGDVRTTYVFDRDEGDKELYLTVRATDSGRPPLADLCIFKIIILDINDNMPVFDKQEYHAEVAEDFRVGDEVLRVFAYDKDYGENSRLTYSFGNPDLAEYFIIDPNSGVIFLNMSLAGQLGQQFSSTVIVTDHGEIPLSTHVDISFKVGESGKKPPTLTASQNSLTLREDMAIDKAFVNVSAISNMKDPSVIFNLMPGRTPQTNQDTTFSLSPISDTMAEIKLKRPLDYEAVTEYQLTVTATNKHRLSASMIINIKIEDVNDEYPTFVEFLRGSVVENTPPGAQAMTVRAIDKDGTAPFNEVMYKFLHQADKDKFSIDSKTGVITTNIEFDRENETAHHVIVQAYDGAPGMKDNLPNTVEQSFEITIEDVNDNPPKFKKSLYFAEISELSDLHKDVLEVEATDKDTASSIEYSIIEGNYNDDFYIDSSTRRIKVQNKLDFEKIEGYNLTVKAFDGQFNDTTKVNIKILNANDELPVFEPYNTSIKFPEEQTSVDCLLTLVAYDPDEKNRSADQKIKYTVLKGFAAFLSVDSHTGCVKITRQLDRDYPTGLPKFQVYIKASDNNGEYPTQEANAELVIDLIDINDNAPFLNVTETVWDENQPPDKILTLEAEDYDTPNNGPPFRFEIDSSFEFYDKFKIEDNVLVALVTFDREERKFYDIPIRITDHGSPTLTGVSVLRVIIGDKNDNAAKDGSSEIFVYKYEGFTGPTTIGRAYVDDLDDWDLPDKVFQLNGLAGGFTALRNGTIIMPENIEPGGYDLKFLVTEIMPNGQKNVVSADVKITVRDIPEEAVRKSGSIRISGITIEEFIEKDPFTQLSKKDKFQRHLAQLFNISESNVDVFTVLTSPSASSFIDVRFSAHSSPYYAPERLDNKVVTYQSDLESMVGVQIHMITINECINSTCYPKSCTTVLSIKNEPALVYTNKTSFVGVKAITEAACECLSIDSDVQCFNGGTVVDGLCNCLEGFQGPNCELLDIGFSGNGWAIYKSFGSCNVSIIKLGVLPKTDDGLIFYSGPSTKRQAAVSNHFVSLELIDGYVVLKIEVGSESVEIVSTYKKINDGVMHYIKINITTYDLQLTIDDCLSDCYKWQSYKPNSLININGFLQLGGRSSSFNSNWTKPPISKGFIGCITNLTYNSYTYNLGAPSDKLNVLEGSCNYATFQAASFGINSNFLVAILVCVALLLGLLLAVVVHKRKQLNLNEKEDMDDTRANIINYEDEGGGECDTNFDLSVLRNNYDEKPPIRDNLYSKQANDVPADIGTFLDDKKRTCDKDALPYDDVRHYAYEGDGNSTGSLSSLASCTTEDDLKFNYLSSYGPRFRKLADMYGDDASEEENQNEESWC